MSSPKMPSSKLPLLKTLEAQATGHQTPLPEVLDAMPYNAQGLIAAIAQDSETRNVLMLGWMDRHAIETTLEEGYVTYFSRSRQTYWKKGETSGHLQALESMHLDCDGDALLLQVKQTGPACHTNRASCFYLAVADGNVTIDQAPAR